MTKVKKFTFNGFQENTFIISDTNGIAVVVDPGCYEAFEEKELFEYIEENKLKVVALLNTHAHIDHILGNQAVLNKYKVPHYLHQEDILTLTSVKNYAHAYGFNGYKESPLPTNILKGGEELEFGELKFKVYFTPGHAPGHVVYHLEKDNILVNGDVLFKGSFGRVDLPGGSMDILKKTILNVMFKFPEETVVLTGHGPETTIGDEKRTNYILEF
ncbi:MAG: hydroxyacylglutathione hydrolase [Lentimonas sp.]|jgi:hydroxyacylglutathione hydrolase